MRSEGGRVAPCVLLKCTRIFLWWVTLAYQQRRTRNKNTRRRDIVEVLRMTIPGARLNDETVVIYQDLYELRRKKIKGAGRNGEKKPRWPEFATIVYNHTIVPWLTRILLQFAALDERAPRRDQHLHHIRSPQKTPYPETVIRRAHPALPLPTLNAYCHLLRVTLG